MNLVKTGFSCLIEIEDSEFSGFLFQSKIQNRKSKIKIA